MARVPFDSLTLRAVLHELGPLVVGGQLQHIRGVGRDRVVVRIRSRGTTRRLLLSADPEDARLHLIAEPGSSWADADHFVMALRKHVEGGRITECRQVGFDRIAHIGIVSHRMYYRLVCECMGKHSNVLLLNSDDVILDCIRHVGASSNRLRTLLPGQPYHSPPAPSGAFDVTSEAGRLELNALLEDAPSDLAARLQSRYVGMSPFLSREVAFRCARDGSEEAWRWLVEGILRHHWEPVVLHDRDGLAVGAYPLRLAGPEAWTQRAVASVNEALGIVHTARCEIGALDTLRTQVLRDIRDALGRREAQLADAQRALGGLVEAERLRRHADLLLAWDQRDTWNGSATVAIPDLYGDGKIVEIALQPGLGIAESAEAMYRRARKLRSAADWSRQRQGTLVADVETLRALEKEASVARTVAALTEIGRRLKASGLLPPTDDPRDRAAPERADRAQTLRGVRELTGPLGWRILVGQNAEGNDAMLRRLCRPNDVWFHVRSHTSAHVVVRNPERKPDLPAAVVEFAARLAARSSKAKHSSVVPVDYTLCKYVRRPKGAAHGRVTYSHERTVDVDPRPHEEPGDGDS